MALSIVFETIKQLNNGILKGAKELAKKEGMTGNETIFLMQTTTGKVLFDVADRQKLDETLVKATGDVIQTILLRSTPLGWIIDYALWKSGNSIGNYLLDYYVEMKNTSFSKGYIYKPEGLVVNGIYMPGEYFRVGTITTPDGRTRIARDNFGHFMSAEVISQSMYESVHPDYNDLYKLELSLWDKIDATVNQFSPDHEVTYENGVLSVKFPDGHIEAEALETGNSTLEGESLNDMLVSNGNDTLRGGGGDDTYIAGDGDTISDSDGVGHVEFEDTPLSGGKWNADIEKYEGDGGLYTLEGSKLTFVKGGKTLTINHYDKEEESLGIKLERGPITISAEQVSFTETDSAQTAITPQRMNFHFLRLKNMENQ